MKVLYIMGMGRSGSTILGNLVGEGEGFVSVGELHNLWKRGILSGDGCGCGLPLSACPFWSRVLERAVPGEVSARTAWAWQRDGMRSRDTLRLLRLNDLDEAPPPVRSYGALLSNLYKEVGDASGARVVVDSSKWPAVAALLPSLPGIDPYLVHLVRDPRAVAYSRSRAKTSGQREMRRAGPIHVSSRWLLRNGLAEAVSIKYPSTDRLTMRYEDLVGDPRSALALISEMIGEPIDVGLSETGEITMSGNHNVAGNPNRFDRGPVRIALDRAWADQQTRRDRYLSTMVSLPLLLKYGYRATVAAGAGQRERLAR